MSKSQEPDSTNLFDSFNDVSDLQIDQDNLGYDIDLDDIGDGSKRAAADMIENLSRLYCNSEFIAAHPTFKRRVDSELETLQLLIKMRRADEIVQDNLIKAISANSKNASLYKALADIQKTILSISVKMDSTIATLNTFIKGYQLELEFKEPQDDAPESDSEISLEDQVQVTMGSRNYIQKMQEVMEREQRESADDYNSDNELYEKSI